MKIIAQASLVSIGLEGVEKLEKKLTKEELLKQYLQKYAEHRQIRTLITMIVKASKHALTEQQIMSKLKSLGYNCTHWAIRKILWKMVRDKELLKIKYKNQRYYLIFDEDYIKENKEVEVV